MRELNAQERAAMEAVAREFSAKWEAGSGLNHAYLRIAGKRVAVEIRTLKQHGKANAEKPRLRFDRVATRLMDRLRAACGQVVPDGMTVLLTVTAPILLPAKTAETLEDRIKALAERGAKDRAAKETVHGNGVQIRLVRGGVKRPPKLIGFVHNPETDSIRLLDQASAWLELNATPGKGRWLVVISDGDASWIEADRAIYGQLGPKNDFQKVVIVFDDGSVEILL